MKALMISTAAAAAQTTADAAVSQPLDALAVCAAVEQAVAGNA